MSILRLADQPAVSWARYGNYGEGGTKGYQMDASGIELRNRMMHQDLLPATSDVSLQTRLRLKSTLVTYNSAFEGIAVRHRGFKLVGDTPSDGDIQVWDSQPEIQGKKAWISGQVSEFTTFNFINPLPPGLGIDYVTWELVLRASGGQVDLDNAECRYYYGKPYDLDILGAQSFSGQSAFSRENVAAGVNGADAVERGIIYLQTLPVEITKGQVLDAQCTAPMNGVCVSYTDPNSPQFTPCNIGLGLKLRRKGTTTYDYFDVASSYIGYSSTLTSTVLVRNSMQAWMRHSYDQAEQVAFIEPTSDRTHPAWFPSSLAFSKIDMDMTVKDFVRPSQ